MKKLLTLLAIGSACAAQAAISVGPAGSGVLSFPSRPAASEWSTVSVSGGDAAWASTQNVIDGVNTLDATAITSQVVDGGTGNPPGQNGLALWTGGGSTYLITRPTGNAGTVLMATVQNTTGADLNDIRVMYSLRRTATARTEQVNGQEVFYSLSGAPGSWVHIPALSGGPTTATTVAMSNTVTFASAWANGANIYFIWADDNAGGGTDDGFAIDDLSFTPLNAALSATLSSPATGTIFASTLNPGTVTVTAVTSGGNPATSVSFYSNDVLIATDTSPPFSVTLGGLLPGAVVNIYAHAQNGTESAYTQTNTVTVQDEFVHFTGSQLSENFDSLGTTGTQTPIGWFVGNVSGINPGVIGSTTLVVSNGNHRPIGAAIGLNMGLTDDGDRALATQATGSDRNMIVRIQNNTAQSITSITFEYDGEVWRPYTNSQFGLTNLYSLDQGATWIQSGAAFNFMQPNPIADPPGSVPPTALDGNLPENRTSLVGGTIDLSATPIPPNGVIYIRWWDVNEGGDDGVLAIDNFVFSATTGSFTPTISISTPTNGQAVAQAAALTVSATPSFANPVTNVTFYDGNPTGGGVAIGNDTNSPFSISVNTLSVGSHTLYAVGRDNSGAQATSPGIAITVNPNVLPSVTITNPPTVTDVLVGANVTVGASATDSDGSIVGVEFYVNNVRRGTNDVSVPYSMEIGNLTAGLNVLSAVAIDNAGGRATNSISVTATNPPGITAIITNGSQWKYFDTGTDPGAGWNTYAYDDTAWLSGFAELGYGDANGRPEVTVINGGVDPNHYATTYFRKKFNLANPSAFTSLTLHIMKDDHAVVYLNGTQIFSDMTNAVITYQTYEGPAVTGDGAIYEVSNNIPSSLLQAQNIIAVEVHQESGGSSDVSFDLMLWGEGGSAGPRLTIVNNGNGTSTISWGADAVGYTLESSTSVPFAATGTPVVSNIASAGSTTVNSSSGMLFYRLRK